jgi:Mg-chelatase subunit ChlD
MAGSNIAQAKDGVLAFALDAVRKDYAVGLVRFSDVAEVLSTPKDGISGLKSGLRKLEASGGTNMTDALNPGKSELMSILGIRVIVIATDGVPNSPESCFRAAQAAKAD